MNRSAVADKYGNEQTNLDLFKNKNVDWVSYPFTWLCYIVFLGCFWGLLHFSQIFASADTWTITNVVHGLSTFIYLHWIKGSPDELGQGEYNALTMYEQIDAGIPWTRTKKFLMLVPTVLCLRACAAADYEWHYLMINVPIFLVCILAKIPEMHRVRILGINSTPGIDDEVDTKKTK